MDEIKKFIEKFTNDSKYITELEELYELFEKNGISNEERLNILRKIDMYNQKIYKSAENNSNRLRQIKEIEIRKPEKPEGATSELRHKEEKIKPTISIDVSMYLRKIKENQESLEDILPNRNDEKFYHIINTILIHLYKERVEIIKLLHEQNIEEQDVLEMFILELDSIDDLMERIINYRDFSELEIETCTIQSNNLYYVKNSNGKPYLYSNLKGMEEYYDSFKELLESIIDGTFKNIRIFSNNNKLFKLMEVRGNSTRIIFGRLNANTFAIIDAFVKKCQTDLRHRTMIEKAGSLFRENRDSLIDSLENEEEQAKAKQYTKELFSLLDQNKRGGM